MVTGRACPSDGRYRPDCRACPNPSLQRAERDFETGAVFPPCPLCYGIVHWVPVHPIEEGERAE